MEIDYSGEVTTLGVREARDQLATAIETAQEQPVVIQRHGLPVAVLISPEVFQRLQDAWEDLEDLKDLEEFDNLPEDHPDRQMIPWEQVERDLGWAS